jgi:hypothetical protein
MSSGSGYQFHGDGQYMAAHDTLKILVVFSRFPDDNVSKNGWPEDDDPDNYQDIIESVANNIDKNKDQNISSYFHQASLDSFVVIGEAVSVVADFTSDYYSSISPISGQGRYHYIKDVLTNKVDSLVDFSEYDNWTFDKNPDSTNHQSTPDGIVDMIVFITKNAGNINMSWSGEASLGRGANINLDNT